MDIKVFGFADFEHGVIADIDLNLVHSRNCYRKSERNYQHNFHAVDIMEMLFVWNGMEWNTRLGLTASLLF